MSYNSFFFFLSLHFHPLKVFFSLHPENVFFLFESYQYNRKLFKHIKFNGYFHGDLQRIIICRDAFPVHGHADWQKRRRHIHVGHTNKTINKLFLWSCQKRKKKKKQKRKSVIKKKNPTIVIKFQILFYFLFFIFLNKSLN